MSRMARWDQAYSRREHQAALGSIMADLHRTPPKSCECGAAMEWGDADKGGDGRRYAAGWACPECGLVEPLEERDEC